jgi:energy-coupling factor transport system permease protein
MLKDITLGQYFPGKTLIHRLDPRTKLIMTFIYIVLLFIAKSYFSYGLMAVYLLIVILISKISVKIIIRGLKPILLLVILTALLNLFYTPGNELFRIWILKVTDAGIFNAFFMVLRIMMLITGTFLLTYTTSPIDLTDGLEMLMNPLKKIKVPVHELSMMMSIALRFIPTLIEETDKIMSAQKARGADFETGNIIQRAKAMLPLLVPLFVSAFRRADELAIAMESRCYHGGVGRTKMKQLIMKTRDYLTLTLGALMTAATIVLVLFGL